MADLWFGQRASSQFFELFLGSLGTHPGGSAVDFKERYAIVLVRKLRHKYDQYLETETLRKARFILPANANAKRIWRHKFRNEFATELKCVQLSCEFRYEYRFVTSNSLRVLIRRKYEPGFSRKPAPQYVALDK